MRSLVTGGAGFLGSHLCDRLIAEGHEVIALDNLYTGSKRNIAHLLPRRDFTFLEHDVVDPIHLEVGWIFNLACPASPVHYQQDPVKTLKTSVVGTFHLLELAQRMGARILQASTSEVYGDPLEHPQKETYWGHVNPIGPRSCYDEGKRVAETLMMDYHRRSGVETRIVRIFNTYGPRMATGDGRVVSNFVAQTLRGEKLTVYGDGTQTRSFCYVDDMVDAFVRLIRYECEDAHEPVNAGSDEERSMKDVVACLGQVVGRQLDVEHRPLPPDDPVRRRPDLTRARLRLDWTPRVSFLEGLGKTVDYFKSLAE